MAGCPCLRWYSGGVVLADDLHFFLIDYGYLAMVLLTGALPLALFFAVAWRPATRALPIIGVASAGVLLVVAYRAAMLPVHLVDGRVPASLVQRFGLDLPLALTFATLACMTFALVILGEAVFRTRRPRRLAILLSATPLYFAVIFTTAMLQRFLVAALARGVWLSPSAVSSILGVPAGHAAIADRLALVGAPPQRYQWCWRSRHYRSLLTNRVSARATTASTCVSGAVKCLLATRRRDS